MAITTLAIFARAVVSSNRSRMIAKVIVVLAAPAPWMKRNVSSIGRECAEAQARLATTTSARPSTMTGLRPIRSEIGP